MYREEAHTMSNNQATDKTMNHTQGHWLLAKMGKKVLRPGGKELTEKMLSNLDITSDDDVVEFAPGLGLTAKMSLDKNPKSYTGVELNQQAREVALEHLQESDNFGDHCTIITGNTGATNLPDESCSKVYGEAMLTMQSDRHKADIIAEAYRILRVGGLYGIHELGLQPDDISEELKREIQKELSQVIKVNARPLTVAEWSTLGKEQGFKVKTTATNAMALLEPKRLIEDEGVPGAIKIGLNVLTHPEERQRILAMRKVFRKYHHHLNAVSLVFEKI